MVINPKNSLPFTLHIFVYRGTGGSLGIPRIDRPEWTPFWRFSAPSRSRIWDRGEMMWFVALG